VNLQFFVSGREQDCC